MFLRNKRQNYRKKNTPECYSPGQNKSVCKDLALFFNNFKFGKFIRCALLAPTPLTGNEEKMKNETIGSIELLPVHEWIMSLKM